MNIILILIGEYNLSILVHLAKILNSKNPAESPDKTQENYSILEHFLCPIK